MLLMLQRANTLTRLEFYCSKWAYLCFFWWVKRHPEDRADFTEQQRQTWMEFADLLFTQHASFLGEWHIHGQEEWDEAWGGGWANQNKCIG